MLFKASAPGSFMLLGEYAVLYGKPALVAAIEKRLTVTLTPRDDQEIHLSSDRLGTHVTTISDIEIVKPFQFILGVLKQFQIKLKRGCDIEVTSSFSDKIGLGSSAAVTVATIAAVVTWLNIRISPLELVRQGIKIVRFVQGRGSGADIAASVYGGIVHFQSQPLLVEKLAMTHPLTAFYSGYKTPTADAIKQVEEQFRAQPALYRYLHQAIGQCVTDALFSLRKNDWSHIGRVMNMQQGLMQTLGVSTTLLQQMVTALQQSQGILGAKISGAGLGDCVIALGELKETTFADIPEAIHVPVQMTLQGVQCEKI